MNRIVLSAFLLASIAHPMPSIAAPCARPGVIQLAPGYAYANIYESPSTSSKVLAQLGEGSKICILGEGQYFYRVQYGQIVGYIVRR